MSFPESTVIPAGLRHRLPLGGHYGEDSGVFTPSYLCTSSPESLVRLLEEISMEVLGTP